MPRKTGYKTRSALSTLCLGDPQLGTSVWDTEYDVEFTNADRQEERDRLERAQQSSRASLHTPRSLKKGYVSGQDYEKLDGQYSDALLAYRDLQLQVGALEQRVASMQGSEHLVLRAVEEQHGLIETLRQQVAAMSDSLGLLLGGVERNKSILTLMNSPQDSPPCKPAKESEAVQGKLHAAQGTTEPTSARFSALEARIGDMADAVAALSRAQALWTSSSAPGPAGRTAGRERGAAGRQSSKGREGSSGQRRAAERIERLPNPIQMASRNSTWKP